MILAQIPNITKDIPRWVRKRARFMEIDVYSDAIPYGADEWIFCPFAWPHQDRVYRGKLFITLSVRSSRHVVGDALAVGDPEGVPVPRGTLFVIDPMVTHWLAPTECGARRGWIGLQWVVDIADAPAKAREIVQELGGTWVADQLNDPRYVNW